MKNLIAALSIVCFSTTSFATDISTCRAAYGKSFAQERTSSHRSLYLRNFIAGSLISIALTHGQEYLFPNLVPYLFKVNPTKYSLNYIRWATIIGTSLALIGYSSHVVYQTSAYNMQFNEIVAHAIDEANSNQSGPSTLSLAQYFGILMAKKSILERFNIFSTLSVPADVTALLNQNLGGEPPTAERVQDALRWMINLGLVCYSDDSALVPTDFTSRLAYALGQVGPSVSK